MKDIFRSILLMVILLCSCNCLLSQEADKELFDKNIDLYKGLIQKIGFPDLESRFKSHVLEVLKGDEVLKSNVLDVSSYLDKIDLCAGLPLKYYGWMHGKEHERLRLFSESALGQKYLLFIKEIYSLGFRDDGTIGELSLQSARFQNSLNEEERGQLNSFIQSSAGRHFLKSTAIVVEDFHRLETWQILEIRAKVLHLPQRKYTDAKNMFDLLILK